MNSRLKSNFASVKKFLAAILCVVYATASSGATLNFHYCMGKFIGMDVTAPISAKCRKCGMTKENKKGCCNDKHATFSLQKDQLASHINNPSNNFFVYLHQPILSSESSFLIFSADNNTRPTHSPPLIQPVSAFILHCVFRI
jgi:hypothetical protein